MPKSSSVLPRILDGSQVVACSVAIHAGEDDVAKVIKGETVRPTVRPKTVRHHGITGVGLAVGFAPEDSPVGTLELGSPEPVLFCQKHQIADGVDGEVFESDTSIYGTIDVDAPEDFAGASRELEDQQSREVIPDVGDAEDVPSGIESNADGLGVSKAAPS